MGDVRLSARIPLIEADSAACPPVPLPRTRRDDRHPLRLRLWIIAGSAVAAWGVAWLGGLVLLRALGLR